MVVTIFTLEAEARAVTPCQPPAVLKRSHHMQYRLEARAIRLPMLTWLEARLYDFVFVFLSLVPARLLVLDRRLVLLSLVPPILVPVVRLLIAGLGMSPCPAKLDS